MSRCLLAGLAWLPLPVPAQDTGGPFTGTVAIGRETSGACIDNRGQRIPEGMLFEPGPDECQVMQADGPVQNCILIRKYCRKKYQFV